MSRSAILFPDSLYVFNIPRFYTVSSFEQQQQQQQPPQGDGEEEEEEQEEEDLCHVFATGPPWSEESHPHSPAEQFFIFGSTMPPMQNFLLLGVGLPFWLLE